MKRFDRRWREQLALGKLADTGKAVEALAAAHHRPCAPLDPAKIAGWQRPMSATFTSCSVTVSHRQAKAPRPCS